jgi:hypothetical protein
VFRTWLLSAYRCTFKKVPGAQALHNAIAALHADALYGEHEHRVELRVAEFDGVIWLDLCDETWRVARITAEGWTVIPGEKAPVRFVRRRGMLPLPLPVLGGSIDELRPFVNLSDQSSWVLCISWLLGAFRPRGPYAILIINGDQGSAKSTLCKFIRALIDPNTASSRRLPKVDQDLMIGANNARVLSFDNLSTITPESSNSLCSLATGAGLGTRELYSNDEEKIFAATRPVILNGIDTLATKPDLLDRAIVLELARIPKDQRRDEDRLYADFEEARPRILGALLTAVAEALKKRGNTVLPYKPRMADFALWVAASAPSLGFSADEFLGHFENNRALANADVLCGSDVATAVLAFVQANETWQGTPSKLLEALTQRFESTDVQDAVNETVVDVAADIGLKPPPKKATPPGWPTKPQALTRELNRLRANLLAGGVLVESARETGGNRLRIVRLTKVGEIASQSSQASQATKTGPDDHAKPDEAGRSSERPSVPERPGEPQPAALPPAPCDAADSGCQTDSLPLECSDRPRVDHCHCGGGEWWQRKGSKEWLCCKCTTMPTGPGILTWSASTQSDAPSEPGAP